ncbi:hypothetical protein JRG66_04695 [Salinimicrobium tongyeongense]|jgi:uncharacterized membrane protein|uniref:DUF4870 domain-containing protein n=1 Tax=Salinimicrobium tongyeongense TaxID=2809707 RepID=A0ABY6NTC6_9FLAO|nr:hypothetical protein [Salinimicrobium tongyeongense]UZH56167.1 hypothetical protein JRG66_04695 [Salinimicrobium tongyeongense]
METGNTHAETKKDKTEDITIAVIAYLTIIGLVVAFVMNNEKKDAFAAWHIRQSMGLTVLGIAVFAIGMVPILGWLISFFGSLFLLYLWIMGLINAINGKVKPVPVLGSKFEEWFKNI